MRKLIFLAATLLVIGAVPATAQQGEWRFATRLTSLTFEATTEAIFDTGSRMQSNVAKVTLALEGQYMVSDALAVCGSLTTAPFYLKGKGGDLHGETLGEIWFTPLTLTLRYEFQLRGGLQPYIGGGLNATFYLFDDVEPVLEEMDVTNLVANPSFGWVLEAGLNYDLNPKTFVNLDIKMLDISGDLDLENDNKDNLDRVAFDGSPVEISLGVGWRW
jgi:outer membrane protein